MGVACCSLSWSQIGERPRQFCEYDEANYYWGHLILSLPVGLRRWTTAEDVDRASELPDVCFEKVCVQRSLKTWKKLFSKSVFTDVSKEIAPYMLFNNSIYQLQGLVTRSESPPPWFQQKTFVDVDGLLEGGEGVDTVTFDRFASSTDAPH